MEGPASTLCILPHSSVFSIYYDFMSLYTACIDANNIEYFVSSAITISQCAMRTSGKARAHSPNSYKSHSTGVFECHFWPVLTLYTSLYSIR